MTRTGRTTWIRHEHAWDFWDAPSPFPAPAAGDSPVRRRPPPQPQPEHGGSSPAGSDKAATLPRAA
jgi:hypothetical protein